MHRKEPVYVRIGIDGTEHLIGWVYLDEPAKVAAAIHALLTAAGLAVEEALAPSTGEESS